MFFKSTNDHKKLAEWYSQNLGIQLEPCGGAICKWNDDKSEDGGLTVWHVAASLGRKQQSKVTPWWTLRINRSARDPR